MVIAAPSHPDLVANFLAFAALPENEARQFELIQGEIIEVSSSRTRNSERGLLLGICGHALLP
ncbi:MAG: hypothetical protein H7Y11_12980 [Armatimonadetes bacterium]|nr:hypothetical protein [Anaerolineae bacterium]